MFIWYFGDLPRQKWKGPQNNTGILKQQTTTIIVQIAVGWSIGLEFLQKQALRRLGNSKTTCPTNGSSKGHIDGAATLRMLLNGHADQWVRSPASGFLLVSDSKDSPKVHHYASRQVRWFRDPVWYTSFRSVEAWTQTAILRLSYLLSRCWAGTGVGQTDRQTDDRTDRNVGGITSPQSNLRRTHSKGPIGSSLRYSWITRMANYSDSTALVVWCGTLSRPISLAN